MTARLLLAAAAAALYVLHQDSWLWSEVRPLVLGFIPIGLFYHMLHALAASCLMAALVRWAWPERLEREALDAGDVPQVEER